jgi:hypothetical protein
MEKEFKVQLLQTIEKFFSTLPAAYEQHQCLRCGATVDFVPAQFRLYGTDVQYTGFVPFCPSCDSTLMERYSPPQNIH